MTVAPTEKKVIKARHQVPPEVKRGESERGGRQSVMARSGLVEPAVKGSKGPIVVPTKKRESVQHVRGRRKRILGQPRTHGGSYLEQMIDRLDASKGVKGLILDSWRPKTRAQYEVYLRQWRTYSLVHDIDHINPPLRKIHNFLFSRFKSGVTFSAVNSARCALSAFYLDESDSKVTVGAHWMTSKVMTGIRNRRPPPPPDTTPLGTWTLLWRS